MLTQTQMLTLQPMQMLVQMPTQTRPMPSTAVLMKGPQQQLPRRRQALRKLAVVVAAVADCCWRRCYRPQVQVQVLLCRVPAMLCRATVAAPVGAQCLLPQLQYAEVEVGEAQSRHTVYTMAITIRMRRMVAIPGLRSLSSS